MKAKNSLKRFIGTLLILSTLNSVAQTVDGVPISEIDTEYILLFDFPRKTSRSTSVNVGISFGQPFGNDENKIKDENGSVMSCNTIIEAVNLMYNEGYEVVTSHTHTAFVNAPNVYYTMRKVKKE